MELHKRVNPSNYKYIHIGRHYDNKKNQPQSFYVPSLKAVHKNEWNLGTSLETMNIIKDEQ